MEVFSTKLELLVSIVGVSSCLKFDGPCFGGGVGVVGALGVFCCGEFSLWLFSRPWLDNPRTYAFNNKNEGKSNQLMLSMLRKT